MLLQDRYEGLKKPEDWLQWFFEAVSPDTEVNQAYIWGKFNFGNDVVNQLNVFADLPDDEQRRAYHRLMMLSSAITTSAMLG